MKSAFLRTTLLAGSAALLLLSPFAARPARAQTVQTGPFTITLQSTLSWTGGVRTGSFDNAYYNSAAAGVITDDGDRNFHSGIAANRFQTVEQLNIQDGDYGLRASALAFIDTVYLTDNRNNSLSGANPFGTLNYSGSGPRGFPSQTVSDDGRRFEPLALFLYGAEDFDGGVTRLNWQIGRQTITWGESLFSPDGVASIQAPADAYLSSLLPNPQVQSIFLPTGAARFAYHFASGVTLDGYWQFEYEPDVLPGVGSYFSPADFIGPGAQQLYPVAYGPITQRAPDQRPNNGLDQFGISLRDTVGNYTYGAYFVRAIAKAPGLYEPGTEGGFGPYALYYPEPENAYVTSISTLLGEANVAGELDGYTGAPLASDGALFPGVTYSNPNYAKGDVINGQVSAIYITPPLPIFKNGMTITAETWFNKVVSITENRAALAPGDDEGMGSDIEVEPNFFPTGDLEMQFPVSWRPQFIGKSPRFDAASAGTGTINVGVDFTYKSNLDLTINYKHFYGSPGRQTYFDRDFVTAELQRTF